VITARPRVDRVTSNTFKLWQVRENLKQSKKLYCEEERLLGEFKKVCRIHCPKRSQRLFDSQVKDALITAAMDDEYFEATIDTCIFLGGKLTEVELLYSCSPHPNIHFSPPFSFTFSAGAQPAATVLLRRSRLGDCCQ
jgi:hypothetical protein